MQRQGFTFNDIYRLDELNIEKLNCHRHDIKITNGAEKAAILINNLMQ